MSDFADLMSKAFAPLTRLEVPALPIGRSVQAMPIQPNIQSIWKIQAELFMEGLREQVDSIEQKLADDQELQMTCWHGPERLQVLRIAMPTDNVVALYCVDSEGNQTQVTGHMNSVTFSLRVVSVRPPAARGKIGFSVAGE